MITEDYVSYETAKLLKKKGFNEFCPKCYNTIVTPWFTTTDLEKGAMEHQIYAPTLQVAMKWLRETFEIHCQIDCPLIIFNWRYGIRDLNKDEWVTLRNMGDYDTYEEACEAAIRYCLENLI